MIRIWDKSRPPQGPFTLNRDCPQAQGLAAWYPMGGPSGRNYAADLAGKYHAIPGTVGTAALGQDGRPGMQLVAASSQHLLNNETPVTDWPMTLTAWGSTDGSTQTAIQVLDTGANINNFGRIVLVSNKVRANCGTFTSGAQANAITTASYVNGELSLFGATFASDTSRTVYLNGGNAVTETTTINPSDTFKRIRLGTALTTSDAILQPWNGFLGECGIWNVALDAAMHMRLYDPSTRYELWYPLRSRKWFSAGTATHSTTGALASQAASVAGTAAHLTLHATSGALASQAGAIAGTAAHLALHATTGALASQAAAISGAAVHESPGVFATEGALASQVASIAGTAAHLTLHETSGALSAEAAFMAGIAVHSGAGALVEAPQTGAGKSRKPRKARRYVVEIDGQDHLVASETEAKALLEKETEKAEVAAKLAVERATKASGRRAPRKIVQDVRRALELPAIEASAFPDLAKSVSDEIERVYRSAIQSVEIALLMRKIEDEEDDEDILLLL